ncbi:MAG: Hsp70 family protein [Methylococcales bacterium]|nr:Hsp70 family protein [Methylococcales bacterium]
MIKLFGDRKEGETQDGPVPSQSESLADTPESSDEAPHTEEASATITAEEDSEQEADVTEQVLAAETEAGAHFSVGIDLGTTHSVLSYVDLTETDVDRHVQEVLPIPQLIAPGEVDDLLQLPSFIYRAHAQELAEGATALPWNSAPDYLVGGIARNLGAKTPSRLIASAKSWLCHAGVDCKAPILPTDAPEEVEKISPYQATVAYLAHLHDAWRHRFPDAPLNQQDLTITVPASFDPAARELTVEAARELGLGQAVIVEEPQAAVYSWIEQSQGQWRDQVQVGEVILVIDIGGGTTDLSLVAVTEQDGNLELNRVAVGDHILLGGDNMDLALAYSLKAKLEQDGKRLEPWQIQALTHACRDAKEKLFNQPDVEAMPMVVPSRGSSLMGGSLRTELTRAELDSVLVNGFMPDVQVSEKPVQRPRGGLRSVGLPYAQDAAITRHLAAFLSKQRGATDDLADISLPEHASFLHPSAVLFNGGVLKAQPLAEQLMRVLNQWLTGEQAPEARLLTGIELDLAVARGAAYYGYVRKGKGVRIKGGTAASYYVGVESAMPAVPGMPPEIEALCIAPFGMEEGTEAPLTGNEFGLVVGEPVRFRFFASKVRRDDPVGLRLHDWGGDELEELDEIELTLPEEDLAKGDVVPVELLSEVTETGTLALHAVAKRSGRRWRVEFDVRAGDGNA